MSDNLFASLEDQYNLPQGLLSSIKGAEKSRTSDISPRGASGTFQFMPATAKAYNVDTTDDMSSATGAAQYLGDLIKQYDGSISAAVAHYNGGTKAGKAVLSGNLPPAKETKDYLNKVHSSLLINPNDIKWDNAEPTSDNAQADTNQPNIYPTNIKWDETPTAVAPVTSDVANFQKQVSQRAMESKPWMEKFNAGLGKSALDFGQGVKQVLDIPAQYAEEKITGGNTVAKSAEQTQQEINQEKINSAPLMNTGAGMTGNIAGNVLQYATGGKLINPNTYKGAAILGSVMGGLRPTADDESHIFNALAEGTLNVAGMGIVDSVGRIAQPVKNVLNNIGQKAVQTLKDAGVPLDAAQATGSTLLQKLKTGLSDNFLTAGRQSEFSDLQKIAYNNAIGKTMGEDITHITPDVIQNAKQRLGQNYDGIVSRNNIQLDSTLQNHLSNISNEAEHILVPEDYNIVQKQIDTIINKANKNGGALDGAQYQSIKTILDKLSNSSKTEIGGYARDLKESLLDGLTRSAEATGNTADVALLRETNKQYGNMKKIENIADFTSGNVSPSKLYNSLKTKGNRYSFYQDDPQLADLARSGAAILPEKTGNSGTTSRIVSLLAPGLATGGAVAAYNAVTGKGDWTNTAEGIVGGIALPKILQSAINNPGFRQYLQEGIPSGKIGTPIRKLLEAPSKAKAGQAVPAAFASYLQSLHEKQ